MAALTGVLRGMNRLGRRRVVALLDADAERDASFAREMNTTPLTTIAPDIFRKRLLIEGYFKTEVTAETLSTYFSRLTAELGLRTYGEPIIHSTGGAGKDINQGFDGFVPLIDSGIYIAVWVNPKFLSTIIYTCGEFDAERAVSFMREFFQLSEFQAAIF